MSRWSDTARTAQARGDFQAAALAWQQRIREQATDVAAWLGLIDALQKLDAYREAHAAAQRLAELPLADDAERAPATIARLRLYGLHAELLALLQDRSRWSRLPARALLSIAGHLSAVGAADLKDAVVQAALAQTPKDPLARLHLAQGLINRGRFDAALPLLDELIGAFPRLPMAHWLRAKVPDGARAPSALAALSRVERSGAWRDEDLALLGFARFNWLDAMGDHAAAFKALQSANAAKRRTLRHDVEADTRFLAQIGQIRYRSARAVASASRPIFIVGLHRSGTTLLERLLARQGSVVDCGETYRLSFALRHATDRHSRVVVDDAQLQRAGSVDTESLAARYRASCQHAHGGAAWYTEKLPTNYQLLPLILAALPEARVLLVRRDPVDVCFSNYKELFSGACTYSYRFDELAAHHHAFARLMEEFQSEFADRLVVVRYEELVQQPELEGQRVFNALGLDWRADATALEQGGGSVNTASSVAVRSPIHQRSIARWRPYADQLAPLIESLSSPQ